ncbi:MAG: TRAP transporter substrate-binding protein [Roseibium sp.]|uniref:TRAP transporter substrate-binding protein n=3 Tax=Roseibium sp. TaxID=1936156 RepID=UPI001B16C3F8|nr:TRAP transporter substrate-binding protein [Roseibium sp.]MBO6892640.1 TRAP transporter substrate-binding protein [Roseibium sp.]MBO6928230.1 TRAP transporter substrate-binding protein [Roseibium sp.]
MLINARNVRSMAIAVLTVATAAISVQPAVSAELKVAHFMPAMHPMDQGVMSPLAEDISTATGGALTMRIYPSGELGKGPVQQYKRVVTGVADIVFGIPEYTPKQFAKTGVVHIPGLFANGTEATNALWDNIELFEDEYAGAKLLGLWANNPSVLITREKPVRTLADMQGMKIRTPNPVMAALVEAWGGIPVSMPTTDTYNAMNTGVIDAVMIGPSGIRSYKLNETAKYVTTNIPSALDSFYLLMNNSSWDQLSDEQKTQLDALTGRKISLQGAKSFFEAGQAGLDLARESGVELIEISPEADAEFRAGMKDTLTAFLDEKSDQTGADAHAIAAALGSK